MREDGWEEERGGCWTFLGAWTMTTAMPIVSNCGRPARPIIYAHVRQMLTKLTLLTSASADTTRGGRARLLLLDGRPARYAAVSLLTCQMLICCRQLADVLTSAFTDTPLADVSISVYCCRLDVEGGEPPVSSLPTHATYLEDVGDGEFDVALRGGVEELFAPDDDEVCGEVDPTRNPGMGAPRPTVANTVGLITVLTTVGRHLEPRLKYPGFSSLPYECLHPPTLHTWRTSVMGKST